MVRSSHQDFVGAQKIADASVHVVGYGAGELGDQGLPDLTWAALRKVPAEFIGMGTLMTGIWWVIDRRMRRQRVAAEEAEKDDE